MTLLSALSAAELACGCPVSALPLTASLLACLLTPCFPFACLLQLLQGATNASAGSAPDPSLTDSFVEVVGVEFVLGCSRFPIAGWNEWEVMEKAAGAPSLSGSQLPAGATGPEVSASSVPVEDY